MKYYFSDFSRRTSAEFALLKQRTDACSSAGRSYELPGCILPAGCTPQEATLGFCQVSGEYLLYIRPEVCYSGGDQGLATLFQPGPKLFSSFESLVARLQQFGAAEAEHPLKPTPSLFAKLKTALGAQILGQEEAVETVAFKLYGHICKKNPARPLSLILYGPTGVGKSELGKTIVPVLKQFFPAMNWKFVWTELNTFTEQHSAYRLIGAPPGYVGYDDQPVFEAVRQSPYTVFMFDELEKAHPEVLKVFMSVLDEGRSTARKEDDAGSRELDFRHCVFIFTTNADLSAGSHRSTGFALSDLPNQAKKPLEQKSGSQMSSLAQAIFSQDESARQALIRSGVLREIAGRFNGFIRFDPLSDSAKLSIVKKQIVALGREYGLRITHVSPEIVKSLLPEGAFSVRSNTGVLEGALTQLFFEYVSHHTEKIVQLTGKPEAISLVSATDTEIRLPVF